MFEASQGPSIIGGSGLTFADDATLLVPGNVTSVTLPRELLVEDKFYALSIRAVSRSGEKLASAPFRSGVPYGYADLYTEYFQP